jgi:hypothetical protein
MIEIKGNVREKSESNDKILIAIFFFLKVSSVVSSLVSPSSTSPRSRNTT